MPAIWTVPQTFDVAELVTAAKLNTNIRDNLEYLKSPPAVISGGQTVQVTSTSFVPLVETQNIVTTAGGRALIAAYGHCYAPAASGALRFYLNLQIDGALVTASAEGVTNGAITGVQFHGAPWAIVHLTNTLAPAFHTFRLYARVASGTVAYWINQFWIMEV